MTEKQFYYLLLSLGWDEMTKEEQQEFTRQFLALLNEVMAK